MEIVIFSIRQDKAKFFLRIAKSLAPEHDITFLTTRYHTYRFLKKNSKVYMLQGFIDNSTDIKDCVIFKDEATIMERTCDFMSTQKIDSQFSNICRAFNNYFQTYCKSHYISSWKSTICRMSLFHDLVIREHFRDVWIFSYE